MNTAIRDSSRSLPSADIVAMRRRVVEYAERTTDENLLAEVLLMLSGDKRPCTYTKEQMAANLREADEDYRAGRMISHEDLLARYGL